MKDKKTCLILANFGGPRSISEIRSFLTELLTDRDVIRTGMPQWLHNIVFRRIAKRRALKIAEDYEEMGGASPIFKDTEKLAESLRKKLDMPIVTFHRYLPATHHDFLEKIKESDAEEFLAFPLFPQFTYATTGSIARWFEKKLPKNLVTKLRWIKSYPSHPAFTQASENCIRDFLKEKEIPEEEAFFIFSAHGVPQKFVDAGDLYQRECKQSFQALIERFPKSQGILSFQSKFGPGEWLKPYTIDVCEKIKLYCDESKKVIFIPISFTSDHIETLVEIENDYLPVVKEQDLTAFRAPALNLREEWIDSIPEIIESSDVCNNQMLIRR